MTLGGTKYSTSFPSPRLFTTCFDPLTLKSAIFIWYMICGIAW